MNQSVRMLAVTATAVGLVACTAQLSGQGRPAATFPSAPPPASTFAAPTPGTPTSSPPTSASPASPASPTSPAPNPSAGVIGCPHIVDPEAQLAYDCITTGMTPSGGSPLWTVELDKEVDTNWQLDQRSAAVNPTVGQSVHDAVGLLTNLLVQTEYGTDPASSTVSTTSTTVDGAAAWLTQTLITIDPAFAAQNQLRVKTERLWVLVIQIDADHRSAFTVSVPDVVQELWPTVPAVIRTVHVR
jgi:hypothetical protein